MAAAQCGVFRRRDAHAVGGTDRMIASRLASGRWERVAPGVYRLDGAPPSFRQRLWVARLVVDTYAVVSHQAAAALHHFLGFPPREVSLLVPHGKHRVVPGAVIHQTRDALLVPCHLDEGLIVSTPARTFIDLAAIGVGRRRLGSALDDAVVNHKVRLSDVHAEFASVARKGKPGVRLLAAVLDARSPGEPRPMSELERAHFALYDRFGGPRPVAQWRYPGRGAVPGCADGGFPDALLAVETDGRRWHTRIADIKRCTRTSSTTPVRPGSSCRRHGGCASNNWAAPFWSQTRTEAVRG